ncbi:STAS domain-containing protein [Kineococcus sp. GCM10028916]|uniref:STAS domain-containing protein n=1 Tax=Kineococcus sp. GCM10028916 TaxID=3273394 RepID=UPI00363ACC0F
METTVNFSVDRYRVGPAKVLQINGELDADTGDLLIACAEAGLADVHHLVLDLSRTAFVDCGGLSALLTVGASARRTGGSARAAGVQGPAALLFDVFDVWNVLGGRHPVELEVRRAVRTRAAITPSHPTSRCSSRARTAPTAPAVCASGG